MDRVAILFSGPFQHKLAEGVDHREEFARHVYRPIARRFLTNVFVATDRPHDEASWRDFLQPMLYANTTSVVCGASKLPAIPTQDQTRFVLSRTALIEAEWHEGQLHWWRQQMHNYWQQYAHVWQSLQVMLRFEKAHAGVQHAYILRARHDYTYLDTFVAAWLETMPCDAVGLSSTEFHTHDRWMERVPPMWPGRASDQFVFGPRAPMQHFANIAWSRAGSERALVTDFWPHIESLLAEHLIDGNVSVVTVEMRIGQPGGPREKRCPACDVVKSPCRYCWDPRTGTQRAGVRDQLCAMRPRAAGLRCEARRRRGAPSEDAIMRHPDVLPYDCQPGVRIQYPNPFIRWTLHEAYVVRAFARDFLRHHPAVSFVLAYALAAAVCGWIVRRRARAAA